MANMSWGNPLFNLNWHDPCIFSSQDYLLLGLCPPTRQSLRHSSSRWNTTTRLPTSNECPRIPWDLYKYKELTKENQFYSWVINRVMTKRLSTGWRKKVRAQVLYCLPLHRKPASFKARLWDFYLLDSFWPSVSPSRHCPFQLSILEIKKVYSMMEMSINLSHLDAKSSFINLVSMRHIERLWISLVSSSPREVLPSTYRRLFNTMDI